MLGTVRRTWQRWQALYQLHTGAPLQGPRWVHVGIADGCNYHCAPCGTHSPLLPPQGRNALLPERLFLELLEDLRLLGTRLAEFGGVGEPLLHPRALPMMRATQQAGIEVLLITNGSLLTPAMCEGLVDFGPITVNVSLNAAYDDSHACLQGAPRGDRVRIVEMVRYLRRLRDRRTDGRPFLSLSIVMTKGNYREALALAEQAIDLDVDHVFFAPLGVSGAITQLRLSPEEDEEARRLVARAEARLRAAGKQSNAADFLDRPESTYWTQDLISHVPCYIGQLFSRVLATGDVHPCAGSVWRGLGNLADARFRDIWHSPAYRKFRRQALLLPRRKEPMEECGCWTCGQHFLLKRYHQQVQLGRVREAAQLVA